MSNPVHLTASPAWIVTVAGVNVKLSFAVTVAVMLKMVADAVPLLPASVAVTVAVPALSAVPVTLIPVVAESERIQASEVSQVNDSAVRALPHPSLAVAVNVMVASGSKSVVAAGDHQGDRQHQQIPMYSHGPLLDTSASRHRLTLPNSGRRAMIRLIHRLGIVRMSSPGNSFSLKLFGGCVLQGATGPLTGRAVQRRRLACLALVGAAGRAGATATSSWPTSGPRATPTRPAITSPTPCTCCAPPWARRPSSQPRTAWS